MDEKRNCLRYPLSLAAKLDPLSAGGPASPCCITDISRSGCRIEGIPLSLLSARRFMIRAYLPHYELPVVLKAIVRWKTQDEKSGYAGCTIEEACRGDKFDLIDLAYKKWRVGIPRYANRNGL